MSVTITTEVGTFTANTCKEARKLERAAAREAERAAAKRQADYQQAITRAQVEGYRILRAFRVECGGYPGTLKPRGHEWCRVTEERREYDGEHKADTVQLETTAGTIPFRVYGSTVVGLVWNHAGWDVALALRDDTTGEEEVYAIGAAGECVYLADLPGLKPSTFKLAN